MTLRQNNTSKNNNKTKVTYKQIMLRQKDFKTNKITLWQNNTKIRKTLIKAEILNNMAKKLLEYRYNH